MPVTYSIDTRRKVIHTKCSGALTLVEVVSHFRTLKNDPTCSGCLDVFLDLREVSSLPESRQLRVVTTELIGIRQKVQFGICAIVATRDALFGMMRMFEVLASQYFREIRVFREFAEAEAWLGAGQAAVDPGR